MLQKFKKQRENKSVSSRNVLSFSVGLTKSWLSTMKSKDKPWMKLNPSKYNPAKQDFTAIAISSTKSGFHPSETDLTA